MDAFPELDIYFPAANEPLLVQAMRSRANGIWEPQNDNESESAADVGRYTFHRDAVDATPDLTLCLARKKPGHLFVPSVVPDSTHAVIPDLLAVIQEFDTQIAAPAAEDVGGLTTVGSDTRRLEDHFSKRAIALLKHFCLSSNAGDLGQHPQDQEKWMAFLIFTYRNEPDRVSGDEFGELLRDEEWWPSQDIPRLATQFNFAMALLAQADDSK